MGQGDVAALALLGLGAGALLLLGRGPEAGPSVVAGGAGGGGSASTSSSPGNAPGSQGLPGPPGPGPSAAPPSNPAGPAPYAAPEITTNPVPIARDRGGRGVPLYEVRVGPDTIVSVAPPPDAAAGSEAAAIWKRLADRHGPEFLGQPNLKLFPPLHRAAVPTAAAVATPAPPRFVIPPRDQQRRIGGFGPADEIFRNPVGAAFDTLTAASLGGFGGLLGRLFGVSTFIPVGSATAAAPPPPPPRVAVATDAGHGIQGPAPPPASPRAFGRDLAAASGAREQESAARARTSGPPRIIDQATAPDGRTVFVAQVG